MRADLKSVSIIVVMEYAGGIVDEHTVSADVDRDGNISLDVVTSGPPAGKGRTTTDIRLYTDRPPVWDVIEEMHPGN